MGARSAIGAAVASARILRHVASDRRVGLVVLFHRVDERPGDPRRELVPAVGLAQFRRQLRWMRRLFRMVSAADIHAETGRRYRWRRIPLAVTFDDEWSTHVPLAMPALRAERVRATFFLTGSQLAGAPPFWWELLEEAPAGEDIFARAATITAAAPAERARITVELAQAIRPPAARAMSADDIRRLAQEHDLGFHTVRHDALGTLSEPELHAALRDGREPLERLAGRPLTLLAYPHGDAGPREARAAAEAGFAFAFTTAWRPCRPDTDARLIGRVEPGPATIGGFLRTLARTLGE